MLSLRVAAIAAVALIGLAAAAPYTVRPGDTLYGIALAHGTTVAAIQRLNGLAGTNLRVGQVLQLPERGVLAPTLARQTVTSPSGSYRFSLPNRVGPGDPATVRVVSPSAERPVITWGGEHLAVVRFGREWVAVGREILGTAPKSVTVTVTLAGEATSATVDLARVPAQSPITLALRADVVAELNDENRAREAAVLAKAYARRTAPAWTQPFMLPLQSATVSAFGSARRYRPGGPVNYHYGEDMPAASGTPVRATNDGTVVISGTFYGIRGGLVGIDHGAAIVSLYFHLSRFNSWVGQKVKRGQVIGYVGSTGISTGPHLHWEMRVLGEATDPMQWVGKLWP